MCAAGAPSYGNVDPTAVWSRGSNQVLYSVGEEGAALNARLSLPANMFRSCRSWCHTCRRPEATCLCACITPVHTRARFVLLTHPREYRRTRIGTGRITHLSLPSSEVHVGIDFRRHDRVNRLIDDPDTDCRLLYPGPDIQNLSRGKYRPHPEKRPVFFMIDSTWACARKVLRRSDNVRALPRVGFAVTATSEFAIKRQPRPECLATIEAAHRCLTLLGAAGYEEFGPEDGRLLLAPFRRIMEIQMGYPGRRRPPSRTPGSRLRAHRSPPPAPRPRR